VAFAPSAEHLCTDLAQTLVGTGTAPAQTRPPPNWRQIYSRHTHQHDSLRLGNSKSTKLQPCRLQSGVTAPLLEHVTHTHNSVRRHLPGGRQLTVPVTAPRGQHCGARRASRALAAVHHALSPRPPILSPAVHGRAALSTLCRSLHTLPLSPHSRAGTDILSYAALDRQSGHMALLG